MVEQRGKTIHVTTDVHRRLSQRGRFKDSYNDIIRRLLDQCDKADEVQQDGQEESSQ